MKFKSLFVGRTKWLCVFYLAIGISIALAYYTFYFKVPSILEPLIKDFGGNLFSGILGGFLFLFLTFYLDAQTEEKIDRIKDTVIKSEEKIAQREYLLKQEQTIFEFEQFIKNETYHNVRFPAIKPNVDSLGLEYTIRPVRDTATNEPIMRVSEMGSFYVVKVVGPAHATDENLHEYDGSPIRDNEYYFCRFINSSWHMGTNCPVTEHEFYLSSKVGPVEYGQSANEFMTTYENPIANYTSLATWYLTESYQIPNAGEACAKYELLKDANDNIALRINDSLLKEVYYTNPRDTWTNTGWFLKIDHVGGYVKSQVALGLLKAAIETKMQQQGIQAKQIPWHQLGDDGF